MSEKVKQIQEQAKQELIAEQKTPEDKRLMSYVCDMVIKDEDKMLCGILEREIDDLKYFIIESYSDKEPLSEDKKKSKECFLRYCDNAKSILKKHLKLLKWKDSQQDLIKGKDEYIAKLCNDRAELKEHEKELIAEQHRLFDIAKEQETELKELKEFAKLVSEKNVDMLILKQANKNIDYETSVFMPYSLNRQLTQAEFDLLKKVVEKYGER